jgi:hypothetical protein
MYLLQPFSILDSLTFWRMLMGLNGWYWTLGRSEALVLRFLLGVSWTVCSLPLLLSLFVRA